MPDEKSIRTKGRFSSEQIIEILKESDRGVTVAALCRRYGISTTTFYKWRAKFPDVASGKSELARPGPSEEARLSALEEENRRLKTLLGAVVLDNAALKELLGKLGA